MRKTPFWPVGVITLACAVWTVTGAAQGKPLSGMPNPDPGNISVLADGLTISVSPHNDDRDYENLQWACDNAAAGGTVELGAGTFFLGDGKDSPRRTVFIRKGLRMVGKKDGVAWHSVIRGGGEKMRPAVGGSLESGPFRVLNESGKHPSVFENIWFREWACQAIYVIACQGFEVRGCRFSHPVNTTEENTLRFVHALWSSGVKARGDFIVENNLVEMGGYGERWPNDEQFLGLWYANHDQVRVINNFIIGVDEAIEICCKRTG